MMGKTRPHEAGSWNNSWRFRCNCCKNIIHGSDSLESAEREIGIFFKEEELVDYSKLMNEWIY